jgi:oligopeptide/dipeptide ABC transporter ATP-binding protein
MTAEKSTQPLLSVRNLGVTIPTSRGPLRIVEDVSFDVYPGELVGLAGESGSGKTISALAVMGLLPFRRATVVGTANFMGRDLLAQSAKELRSIRGKEVSFVFQEPMTSLHPAFHVGDQIAAVVRAHEKTSKAVARQRAIEMIELVGINEPRRRAEQYPHELSGGMQQRVMIALALVCRPRLLIADEPTTALDVTVQAQIVELVRRLQRELGLSVLFITHDLGLLAELCTRMLVMYAGQIVEDATVEAVLRVPRHPYTQALLLAAPRPDQRGRRLPTIIGSPPQPSHFPTGCRFHLRCSYAEQRCVEAVPEVVTLETGGRARCVRVDELDLSNSVKESA